MAVASINMHIIHLNTQLITIYIDISIVKIDEGKDMGRSSQYKKCIFHFYILNCQYLPYYDTSTYEIFNTYRQHLVTLVKYTGPTYRVTSL